MPFVLGVRSVGYTQSVRRFPAKIDGLTGGGGVTAHSALTGLVAPADDHTQYVLATGARAITGTQTINELVVTTNVGIGLNPTVALDVLAGANTAARIATNQVLSFAQFLYSTNTSGCFIGTDARGFLVLDSTGLNVNMAVYDSSNVVLGQNATDDTGTLQVHGNAAAAVSNALGLSLVNKTSATLNNQKWSPALRLVGQGWSTTLTTSQECDWRIYNKPVQSTSPIKSELTIDRSLAGGGYLTKFLIDQNGNVVCGFTGFLGVGATPFLGKCHVDQSNPTGQIAVLGLDQGDQDETFIDFTGTSNAASTNSIRALQTDINCLRMELNSVQPKWMNIFDDSIVGSNALVRFAEIYVTGGAATLTCTTGGTFQLFNLFTTNASSAYCTADAANDKITLDRAGYYLVNFQISFSGTNSSLWTFVARWNGVNQTQAECIRTLGAAGASGSASFVGIVDATAGGNDLEVYCTAGTTGHQMTAVYAQLTATWIGSTEAV